MILTYKSKQRESNFELLRIMAMFMVLILHTEPPVIGEDEIHLLWIWNVYHYVCIIAVDLFVFISGFFAINSTPKSFVKFLTPPIFYTIVLGIIVGEPTLRIPPLFTSPWWFVNAYFLLMVFAPFLNIVIGYTNKRQHFYLIMGLTFLNVWQGFLQQREGLVTGFTIVNFVNIYVFAQYYRKYGIDIVSQRSILCRLSIFLALFLVAITLYVVKFHAERYVMLGVVNYYNSPLVMCGAFLVFTIFKDIKIKSRAINWVASSSFSVYLISNYYFFRDHWYKPFWSGVDQFASMFAPPIYGYGILHMIIYICLSLLINVGIFAVCIIIDKCRVLLTNKLEELVSSKISRVLEI